VYDLDEVAADPARPCAGTDRVRKGHVPAALTTEGERAAARELDRLVALFGRDGVAVELTQHGYPEDDQRNDALAGLPWTPGCVRGDRQRALREAGRAPAGQRTGGGTGPAFAGRDGGLATGRGAPYCAADDEMAAGSRRTRRGTGAAQYGCGAWPSTST